MHDDPPTPFLFSPEAMGPESVGQPHFTGASTGDRLLRDRPDVYRSCVYLLSQATPVREIKRTLGLHHRTIEAVMIREGQTIDTARRELGARSLRIAGMLAEAMEEKISNGEPMKIGEAAMAFGILAQNGQLLTGGITARVELIEAHQVAAELYGMLSDLPNADAEEVSLVDEGSSQIGLAGENSAPMSAEPETGSGGLILLPPHKTDSASDDSPAVSSVEGSLATDSDTESPSLEAEGRKSTEAEGRGLKKTGGRRPKAESVKEGGGVSAKRGGRSTRLIKTSEILFQSSTTNVADSEDDDASQKAA